MEVCSSSDQISDLPLGIEDGLWGRPVGPSWSGLGSSFSRQHPTQLFDVAQQPLCDASHHMQSYPIDLKH